MPASESLRREQVRAVGTAFLRLRPLVALFGVSANAGLLLASGAPAAQRLTVACAMLGLLTLFFVEAWMLRRRQVTERWLLASLVVTALVIAAGALATGAGTSPLLPLLFAPLGVGFAAFGRGRPATAWLAFAVLVLTAVAAAGALLPESESFPAVVAPHAAAMTFVSAVVAVVLLRIGVAGLTDAHAQTAAMLDGLRIGALAEASLRARHAEALGAKVAHDLKNPLSAIKGLMQLLAGRGAEPRDRQRFDVALAEIERMQTTLDDYLSFARPIDDVRLEPLRLDELMRELASLLEPNAERQGVKIRLDTEAVQVMGDPARLRDAVLNLAANALQAMPSGGNLMLCVKREQDRAKLTVKDDGTGMTPEQLAEAGVPFRTSRERGTGLGVALARGVARQHGGELRLESRPGHGTQATLWVATAIGENS
jgi:signal transduction histidine kinase